jgi:hypothetical protein
MRDFDQIKRRALLDRYSEHLRQLRVRERNSKRLRLFYLRDHIRRDWPQIVHENAFTRALNRDIRTARMRENYEAMMARRIVRCDCAGGCRSCDGGFRRVPA